MGGLPLHIGMLNYGTSLYVIPPVVDPARRIKPRLGSKENPDKYIIRARRPFPINIVITGIQYYAYYGYRI